jgi:hypothetical protein
MSTLTEIHTSELASLFEDGRLPDDPFTHRDHVRVAWELLRRYPLGLALHRMTEGVKTLARQRRLPDLFHATITALYVMAIAERMDGSAELDDFDAFAAKYPELLGPSRQFLLGFFTAETLDSDRARVGFVLPETLPAAPRPGLTSSSSTSACTPW